MSNPVTPYETISPFDSDSDIEAAVTADDRIGDDASLQETGSLNSISSDSFGSIPLSLRQGVTLTKVSKKKSTKTITLYLDPDTAKIWWDRNKYLYIDDIKEIRTAEDIRQYRLDAGLPESVESRFFSLIYTLPGKTNTKLLHLIAESDDSFRQWIDALETIFKHRQDFAMSLMSFNDKAVRAYWGMEMERQLGKLRSAEAEQIDFAGVERVCRSLHIHVAPEELRRKFDMAKGRRASSDDLPSGQGRSSRLNFDEFLEFVRLMKTRGDIRGIYQTHANDTEGGMTKDEFLQFVRHVQRENVDEDLASWEGIFARFARKGRPRDAEKQGSVGDEGLTMSETAFASFLTSTSNNVIPKEPQDYVLDRPMNEYYISSSHNTYLIGRQVASVSSHEGYISALLRGCRCVEIDCWEGENNQPVVTHGHTLTTSISFLEVVKTINKYAFVKSHFPLWISLEVRCPPAVQINMAKIMIEVFGDKLVRAPLDPTSDRLPSPSELMDRILIKVKKSDESLRHFDRPGRKRGNSMPSPYQRALTMENVPVPASPLLSPSPASRSNRQINTITEGMVHEPVSSSPSECDSEGELGSAKKVNSKIHPVLGELGVYCMGIHFDGFDSPDAKKFNHIFSFKEKTFAEKNQPGAGKRALYRHNMRYLMRVYPNGARISSSNFDPLIYWKRGVQMAALNWQTFDTGMQLNQAMFDGGTAQSGYVLKPLEGRQIQVMPNLSPDEYAGKRPRKKVAFEIEVISAQQLMRPWNFGEKRTLDPYVEVEVLMADDKRNKADAAAYAAAQQMQLKQRTKIVRDNGFNPEFNQTCVFDVTTKYPDLIFVRFSVKLADKGYNDKAPFATFTAKLSNLKQGYRTIPLLNGKGERFLFSTLFCKIKKGPVTEIMVSYPQEDTPKNGNKLKNIGRNVFTNTSPKSSMDSGRT
jgi:phosphatidylinositol phospholipase C delta